MIKEGQRFARFDRLQPETNFAELHSHRVEIDAEDAPTDDLAETVAEGIWGRIGLPCPEDCQTAANPLCSRDEEVTRAARRIEDPKLEKRRLTPASVGRLRPDPDGPDTWCLVSPGQTSAAAHQRDCFFRALDTLGSLAARSCAGRAHMPRS
jgi:hypothetical protein